MSFKTPELGTDTLINKGIRDPILEHEVVEGHLLEKIIDRIETVEGKGVMVYHKTFPYPEKGIRDKFSVRSAQLAKRVLVSQMQFFTNKRLIPLHLVFITLPWSWKVKIIEAWVQSYLKFIDLDYSYHIREDKYYSACPMEVRKGVQKFLELLGINAELSMRLGQVMGLFLQDDTAYWTRFLDIMSETTKEKLLANFPKEVERLLKLFSERDPQRKHLLKKVKAFTNLLKYSLWIPKIRKALNETLESLTIENMQYDEGDRYNVRNLMRYRVFGMGIKERNAKWPPEKHLWGRLTDFNPDGSPIYDLLVTDGMSIPSVQEEIEEQTKLGY